MRRVGALLLAIILTGCASSVHYSSKEVQREEEFGVQQLLDGDIALLSITAEPELDSFEELLGNKMIFQADSITKGKLVMVGMHEARRRIEQASLDKEYQETISPYQVPSGIDKYFLSRLTDVIETRYYMFVHLQTVRQPPSYSSSSSRDRSLEFIEVKATSKVWNGITGDLVWTAESKVVSSSQAFPGVKNLPAEYARKMAQGFVETLLADYDNFVKDYLEKFD